jgi:hypothetical protein
MTTTTITSARLGVTFHAGTIPRVPPDKPEFKLALGPLLISVAVSPKTAKRLALHMGGAKLEGRLVTKKGQLQLLDAGFQLFDQQTAQVENVG